MVSTCKFPQCEGINILGISHACCRSPPPWRGKTDVGRAERTIQAEQDEKGETGIAIGPIPAKTRQEGTS